MASGATTLAEVLHHPDNIDFKENLEKMHAGECAIPEQIEDPTERAKFSIHKLLGAMRSRADRRSYESKSKQNQDWINSSDEIGQFMIKMISRNDVTVSLAKKAQREQLARKEAQSRLQETLDQLETCLSEKATLKVNQS